MKKVILAMFVAAFGVASVSAQYYVGGSLGYTSEKNDPKGGTKTSASSFSIAPEFGYSFDEKLDFGISLGFLSMDNEDGIFDREALSGYNLSNYKMSG